MYTESKNTHQFEWGAFVSGILFVVAGFFMLGHQNVALRSLVLVFAIISIIQGFVWLVAYSGFKEVVSGAWLMIVAGIVDFLIGIGFILYDSLGAITLAYLFAIWFLTDSIIGIVFSWHLKDINTAWFITTLILNILSVIVAFMMIINPALSALTLVFLVAAYLIMFGINNIFQAIAHR